MSWWTVYDWERGKRRPNRLARRTIDELADGTKRVREDLERIWRRAELVAAEKAVRLAMRKDLTPAQELRALKLVIDQVEKALNPPPAFLSPPT